MAKTIRKKNTKPKSHKSNFYIEDNQMVKMKDISTTFFCDKHGTQAVDDIYIEGGTGIITLRCGCELTYKGVIVHND